MLPRSEVLAWRSVAPWDDEGDIEQDLIITRALFDIFHDEWLAERLAFRGGTALHRLYLAPPARYSQDIDLVQRHPEGIGTTFDRLRKTLAWLGKMKTDVRTHPKAIFAFETDTGETRKLKLEINTHEHFATSVPFVYTVESEVLSDSVEIPTYTLDELLGTKLRALYQRRKGRDLFDFWWAREQGDPHPDVIVRHFREYMTADGARVPSAAELRINLEEKVEFGAFAEVGPLLRTDVTYDWAKALEWFENAFFPFLDGDDGSRRFARTSRSGDASG